MMEEMHIHERNTITLRDKLYEINQRTTNMQHQAYHNHNILLETRELADCISGHAHQLHNYHGFHPH
jgi:hypothetical protein